MIDFIKTMGENHPILSFLSTIVLGLLLFLLVSSFKKKIFPN
jgi:hypothetical protein